MKKTVVQAIIGIRRNRWVSRGMCAVLRLGDSRKLYRSWLQSSEENTLKF